MDSSTSIIRQFLIEAQRCVASDAVAFTSPSRDQFHFHSTAADAHGISKVLRSVADTFLLQSRNRTGHDDSGAFIRNRVRHEKGGPLLGRFLIAPVPDSSGDLAGIVMAFRPFESDEFNRENARESAQLSCQLGRLLSRPADPITGLMARTGVEKLIDWRLNSLGEHASCCVLYGDIDQLHLVNDVLGFDAGDRTIAAVANALAGSLTSAGAGDGAVLSRLSGDRFTVFLPDCQLPEAQRIADRLRHAAQRTAQTAGDPTAQLSISFGAAELPAGERSLDHALAGAEVACKAAKDRGRNRVEIYQLSDACMGRRRDDAAVIGGLRSALEERRYQIFGQPIASLLQPDSVHRYEMLLRIVDEQGRLLLPAHFMSPAGRYQLLPQIDRCVIGEVLDHLRTASKRPGFQPLHVSINLCGPTIADSAFPDWLLEQLDESGVCGEWLTFELTETAAVSNMEAAQLLMSKLRSEGCRFALDNFGTGLSSLTQLQHLQFSSLKIDGAFIRDLLHNERSQSLVRAVTQLAAAMEMVTVAEYVETPEVCMRLIELEVQFGQGYAIGKPRPLSGILAHS
jgi:diguanylate cyclase (GGDEF)-like protein